MPKKKGWRKSVSRRTDWRSRKTGKYDIESPERMPAQSPEMKQAISPELMPAQSPEMKQAISPELMPAQSPEMKQATSPERMPALNIEKIEKPVKSNELEKLAQKEKLQSKHEKFQSSDIIENNSNISQAKKANIDFKSLIARCSSSKQTDFDTVFLDTFPGVAANYQLSVSEEFSERENIALSPEHITQQNEQLHENVTAQHHFNSDPLETCSGNDIATYQAIRSSEQLWNASDLVFGSFHQNDVRFSEQSRGYQCTCNALCILSYSLCLDVDNSLMLDKVLCEGDALYQTVISNLKTDGKFVQQLLSLEEIPDDFEVEIGKFTIEKFEIKSGPLIDAQDLGLPTLHEVLQSAFLSVSSGLLTIGAICSAVFKKNGLYVFFDSHSHGENGLSSSDGASCLITFSNLNDLVTYLYAFYDSMKLDTYLQFDFLPMNVRKCEDKQSYKDEMASHMEAYFNDQRLKQAIKTQSNVRNIPYDLSSVSIKDSKKSSGAKRKKLRIEYYKNYRRQSRQNAAFKSKEIMYQKQSKQSARKNPAFKTKERESKQSERRNPVFRAKETVYQRESKQSERRNPVFRTKERESKQSKRRNPVFRTKERESKQSERRNPVFRAKETVYQRESKQSKRRNPVFRTKERESKQSERRNPVFRAKERESKQSERRNPVFRAKERESKQSERRNPVFRTKERESKQLARENQAFIEKEKVYQNASKKRARENPYVLECERIRKQQIRQEKRKINEISEVNVPRKRFKHDTDTLPKGQQKDFKTIQESIKQFHSNIAIGPLYVCSCCHQTWFRKSVSMLKNTHISAESRRLHCTNFTSIGNEEWICHTCLSALRECKPPKLSVSNGMKWPDKPPELNLHQLEERLIALRIPFMQIRELPRGGQYSLKGNVINVPVDIQPTINCLPRPMDENFTVAIQLKKKLAYKKS